MKEKKVISLKIVFEDGNDYSLACQVGLDKDEVAKYIERVFKPEPAEPLIKDEKIRKAVRAWAEAESEDCYYGQDATTLYNGSGDHIEFWSRPFKDLTPYEHYTIAELCGEEEE